MEDEDYFYYWLVATDLEEDEEIDIEYEFLCSRLADGVEPYSACPAEAI